MAPDPARVTAQPTVYMVKKDPVAANEAAGDSSDEDESEEEADSVDAMEG